MAIERYLLDRCVLRPTRHAIDPGELIRCWIPLREQVLETFVATNLIPARRPASRQQTDLHRDWESIAPPRTLLIKFPGTAGRAERSSPFPANLIAEHAGTAAAESGSHYETWTWNPPGYGCSSGRASLQTLFPAAQAFAERVLECRCGDRTRVWICGNSLGCLSALSLAAQMGRSAGERSERLRGSEQLQGSEQSVSGAVAADRFAVWLRNPPDLAEVVLRVADKYASRFFMRRVVGKLPPSLNAIESAGRCRLPAVFLMSQLDTLVPPFLQQRIHQNYAGAHRVVSLAELTHGGPIEGRHRGDVQTAVDWLSNQTL